MKSAEKVKICQNKDNGNGSQIEGWNFNSDKTPCCQCGRRYKCRGCSCVKEGKECTNCNWKECENRQKRQNLTGKVSGECNESEEHKMVLTLSQRQEEDSKGIREEGREARNKTLVNDGEGVEMEEAASQYSLTQKRKPEDNQVHSTQTPSCIINVEGDRNCFFRCLSQAPHRTQEKHSEVRADIVKTMRKEKAFYGPRTDGDF